MKTFYASAEEARPARDKAAADKASLRTFSKPASKTASRKKATAFSKAANPAMTSFGRELGKQIFRGIFST